MQRFNPKRFKPKGKPKAGQRGRQKVAPIVGQTGRPRGAKKKALPPLKNVRALAQQKTILENQIRGLLEEIRKSGKPCLDREILAKYRKIGRIAESIREIDGEIQGGKTQKPRYARRPRKRG